MLSPFRKEICELLEELPEIVKLLQKKDCEQNPESTSTPLHKSRVRQLSALSELLVSFPLLHYVHITKKTEKDTGKITMDAKALKIVDSTLQVIKRDNEEVNDKVQRNQIP